MIFRQYLFRLGVLLAIALVLSACGGGSRAAPQSLDNDATGSRPQNINSTSADEDIRSSQNSATPHHKMMLSGHITYDRVPFDERSFRGLDYSQTHALPARGVTVQLLDQQNQVRASTTTDADGHYHFQTDKQQNLRVRVLAELRGNFGSASWDIQVRDNTRGNAQYVLDGSLANTGEADHQTRNLHAASGWDGTGYTAPRSAASFAVLDSLYDALQLVLSADPEVLLPPLTVYWSEQNIAVSGNYSEGHIGTSFYTSAGPSIYLLGYADNDTDEYDRGVVQHEFAHYLEHQLGRTESIGGSHSTLSRLDMRVAFGEAWGNAFSGMVSGDPLYRDSLSEDQSRGFTINLKHRNTAAQGWFNEASIQAFLYELHGDPDSDGDQLQLGFKPIYDVLTSERYLNFDGFASVYAFRAELETQHPHLADTLTQMLWRYKITGSGWYGEGETNNAGSALTLPVYRRVAVGQTVNVCSDSRFQKYNGVDVRRFLHIPLPHTRNYTITAVRSGGKLTRTDPQLKIYRHGSQVASLLSRTPDREHTQRHLQQGTYVFEVYEESNADHNFSAGGLACFDVRVE